MNAANLDSKEAYQTTTLDLADYGLEDGIMGVIFIPSLNIEMPLYFGANSENMAKGAVVLGQTSLQTPTVSLPDTADGTARTISAKHGIILSFKIGRSVRVPKSCICDMMDSVCYSKSTELLLPIKEVKL